MSPGRGAEHLLALDLGTTGVRALVVHASGAVRSRAWRRLAVSHPAPGRVEQDPRDLAERSLDVLRAALVEARLGAADCAALGVVTQRSTALAWDARVGEPLAPAIGWQDQRTAARVAELKAAGVAITTLVSATKFEAWLRGDGAVRDAARAGRLRLGTPDAWLVDRLTGGAHFDTDASQACCTGLYDGRSRGWSAAALALFGLDVGWLPSLVPTSAVAGETDPSLLGVALPVAARAGDQQAATFAQACTLPGAAKLTLGTSAMLDVHTGARPVPPPRGAYPLVLWELSDGARAFCLEGTVVTAGAAVDWLVSAGLLGSAAEIDAAAAGAPSSEGLVFVPALQGLGTPHLAEDARGLVLGITRGSGRAALARAALEGIAQRCADLVETLPVAPGPLRVDGGLARSCVLLQTLADLTGRTVERAAETETTALGAALLAGLAVGLLRSPGDVASRLAPPARFEPAIGADERDRRRAVWADAVRRAL